MYSPGHNFPSFSVTGTWCALRCEHCKGRFLRGMISATSSAQLLDAARAAKARGARGILVSGGCDAEGRVPLAPFVGAIARLRSEGLMVNVHTGLLDEAAARELASASAEAFSVDLLQDLRSSGHRCTWRRRLRTMKTHCAPFSPPVQESFLTFVLPAAARRRATLS